MSHAQPALPRAAMISMAVLVVAVVALAAAAPSGLADPPKSAQAARIEAGMKPVIARDLRFLDRADGAVLVRDAAGARADIGIAPGSNQGFIRGVMRGLARDRRMRGIDARPPFRLALWPDGRLSLEDVATGRVIELDSFGADNRAAFARLLEGTA